MTVSRLPNNDGGIQPTILTAKGDLLTATAASTIKNLPVGANDQILVADSTQSTGMAWKSYGAQGMAGKNAVINGGMDNWQRGTSVAITSGQALYTADRWNVYTGGPATTTTRQTTNDTTNLPNIQYCARVQRNSGQTSTVNITTYNTFETVNSIPFAGKFVTLSFYARAGANFSGSINAVLMTGTGTDQFWQSFTSQTRVINSAISLTTTWQRFTYSVSLASTITQLAVGLEWNPSGTAGANDYFEITGVQLELGSTATPFSRAGGSIGGELALCQRYYIRYLYGRLPVVGIASSTSTVKFAIPIGNMRTQPTILDNNGMYPSDSVTLFGGGTYTFDGGAITNFAQLSYTTSGLTQYRPYFLSNSDANSYIGFSAEL